MPGDLILVYFLADIAAGYEFARTRNDWPLHITLVPWFGGADSEVLQRDLDKLAGAAVPFRVTVGEEQKFNPETTVNVVAETSRIRQLHEALLLLAEAAGGKLRADRWILGRYKAHITHHEDVAVPQQGTSLVVGAFWLVSLLPGNRCRIERAFHLGAGQ